MIHRLVAFTMSVFCLILTILVLNADTSASEPIVIGSDFIFPESVIHDEVADLYYVSNLGYIGPINPHDPNWPKLGFISRVNPDSGVIEDLNWISGLIQPKGLAIDGDILYVADVNAVRLYDRRDGTWLKDWPVPIGPDTPYDPSDDHWLNDVTVGPSGVVYASDTGLGLDWLSVLPGSSHPPNPIPNNNAMVLYKFDGEGGYTVLEQGKPNFILGPNGIVTKGNNLFIASFLSDTIYRTNASGRTFLEVTIPEDRPIEHCPLMLDGLVRMTDNSLLVSSWNPPAIYKVDQPRKKISVILEEQFDGSGLAFPYFWNNYIYSHPLYNLAPADIGFDYVRNNLLIPILNGNMLIIYPMD